MKTLTLYTQHNHRQNMYGMETDRFWKLFLCIHDKSGSREEFSALLEKAILKVIDPSCSEIYIKSKDVYKDSIEHTFRLMDWILKRYVGMVNKCAKYFGVCSEMIDRFPNSHTNKADLQAYFINRQANDNTLTRIK